MLAYKWYWKKEENFKKKKSLTLEILHLCIAGWRLGVPSHMHTCLKFHLCITLLFNEIFLIYSILSHTVALLGNCHNLILKKKKKKFIFKTFHFQLHQRQEISLSKQGNSGFLDRTSWNTFLWPGKLWLPIQRMWLLLYATPLPCR